MSEGCITGQSTDFSTRDVLVTYEGDYPQAYVDEKQRQGWALAEHVPPSEYAGYQNPGWMVFDLPRDEDALP